MMKLNINLSFLIRRLGLILQVINKMRDSISQILLISGKKILPSFEFVIHLWGSKLRTFGWRKKQEATGHWAGQFLSFHVICHAFAIMVHHVPVGNGIKIPDNQTPNAVVNWSKAKACELLFSVLIFNLEF